MISFRTFLQESGMIQDVPPDYTIQTWVLESREEYHREHGEEHGERLLYAEAWKKFNNINK